jgi:hypothetical protein
VHVTERHRGGLLGVQLPTVLRILLPCGHGSGGRSGGAVADRRAPGMSTSSKRRPAMRILPSTLPHLGHSIQSCLLLVATFRLRDLKRHSCLRAVP